MTPPPDNSHHLARWREDRRAGADERTAAAIEQMVEEGTPVTFANVARLAAVSRSWLYASGHADAIRSARDLRPRKATTITRASDASNRSRLEDALAANQVLRAEVKELRRQLELALGRLRADF